MKSVITSAAYLSSYNQHKYYQLAEKYKLLVKLPFGIVVFMLAVQPYYTDKDKGKQAEISRISLPIPLRPSKIILEKSKYFKKIIN